MILDINLGCTHGPQTHTCKNTHTHISYPTHMKMGKKVKNQGFVSEVMIVNQLFLMQLVIQQWWGKLTWVPLIQCRDCAKFNMWWYLLSSPQFYEELLNGYNWVGQKLWFSPDSRQEHWLLWPDPTPLRCCMCDLELPGSCLKPPSSVRGQGRDRTFDQLA